MNSAIRYVLAILAGVGVAFLLVAGIETIGHQAYPPPAGLDFSNAAQLAAYVQALPPGALLLVLAAWAIAAFAGGVVACAIARNRAFLCAGIIGAAILLAAAANLSMLPHPAWFAACAIAAILLATVLAARVGRRLQNRSA